MSLEVERGLRDGPVPLRRTPGCAKVSMTFTLPIEGGPKWLTGLELTSPEAGKLEICIAKRNGYDYGSAIIDIGKLRSMLEFLEEHGT